MKYLNGVALAIALASHSFAVSVDFYDEQQNNSSATGVRLRINNDSSAPITNAKLRYYYHRTSVPDTVEAYYLPNATVSKYNVNDTLAYFELSIPSISVGYYPDMSGFSLALHNQNWSSRDKTKDYSYQTSSSLTQNTKIVLLSGDDVIFGAGPNVQSVSEPGILKISGLKFSDSAWIEIKNVGASTVSLSDYQLVNTNDSAFSLGNDTLAVNEILRVCQNQAACGDAGKTLINSVFGWGSIGEAILKKDTSMASYVAWGQTGAHAAMAVNAGLWSDSLDYFPAEMHVQQHNADYVKNTFFRLKSNKSGIAMDDWFGFTSNDNPAKAFSVPLPIKTSANQPVYKLIPGENDVLFSWLPVQGVNSYKVIVRDQNNNDVYNLNTSSTSVTLALAPGNYNWTVIGDDEFLTRYENPDGGTIVNVNNLYIQDANINTSIFKQLKIQQIKARRDTKMLNLGYLNYSYKYSWDKPNLDALTYELHESFRCWAVAIEVMNHRYGGNLTQDEIVYHAKYKTDDRLLSPFYRDASDIGVDAITGELVGDITETLKWALHTNSLNYVAGPPSYATVKNAIDNGKLIYVGVPQHAMVIFGYVGDANNYAFYYAFIDNNGNVGNSLSNNKQIEYYLIPDVTYGDVEMSEATVHMDSDGDGITDFEELNRFGTNPLSVDSDNDGIEDKREIYNYTAIGGIDKTHIMSNPYGPYVVNYDGKILDNPIYEDYDVVYNKADKNKNSIFAELDSDENGNGIEDGLEGNNASINMDVPGDYTIFGREFVRINDRVKCYNTSMESDSYCNVAASDENIFSYDISYAPINIGAQAHVGNIDVRTEDFMIYARGGCAFPGTHSNLTLRNSSVVHGNINIYAVPQFSPSDLLKLKQEYGYDAATAKAVYFASFNALDYLSMQYGATVEGDIKLDYISNWTKEFTYEYSVSMPVISVSQTKVVQNGQTYRLKDGDAFSTLRVEPGGTLIIEPGEMFVDKKLQIEPNSTIRFAEPGKGTILHTNGDIIWRTYNSEPAINTQYWSTVARGFKLAHHSSQSFYIGGLWAGTIYAPKAKVVMGQVNKIIYGRILGRDVIVHQNSNVYRVDFDPTDAMQVSYAF